jgi:hypothetical protein
MPTDLIIRIDLDLLYPPFVERLLEVKARARKRGRDYHSTEGLRSYARSFQLYQAFLQGGPRAAPAGASGHNFGLCTDECLDADLNKPGLQPDWRAPQYAILGEEAIALGLDWGNRYNDSVHIGWPGFVTRAELAPLDKIWRRSAGDQKARLRAVWDYVDTHSPPMPAIGRGV